ncbi:CHAT domain-containing protein [Micromonospora carbonacea]|uniref:CHAT domain-containing protein n=1 Tax=Micromonospora carbonacea TaxID=47853 RepID=A0A7H8XNM3_9ACTN|nr:CHAT domain-containing protein [Micromonospora carbonacea]MBB5825608.1 tetratricopeptide (TPR) repeat protein [Micromonospora carbonacea]QLD26364.1 CHAT domain-containing protein [Micromonospora carbonacea]
MPSAAGSADAVDPLVVAYNDSGDESLLVRAEGLARGLLAEDPSRVDVLAALSTVLMLRGRASDPARLDAAVAVATKATALTSPDDPWWPYVNAQLASVVGFRFEHRREVSDLSVARRHADVAVAAAGESDPLRTDVLIRCVNVYRLSFERFGRLADIDTAVRLSREIHRSTDPDHALTARQLLALCLVMRFARTGGRRDLDEAIAHCRDGLAAMPERHVDRAALNGVLVIALVQRWVSADGDDADLHEAVRVSRRVVEDLPAVGAVRAQLLATHGALLVMHGLSSNSSRHLDEAIRSTREAVDSPTADTQRAGHLVNLAHSLLVRARMSSDPAGVSDAVETGMAALAGFSPGHPDRARALNVLGMALRTRYLIAHDPADLDAAVGMWRSAAASRAGAVEIRMTAARTWARTAAEAGDAELALEAYVAAVELLPLLAWRGLDRAVQEKRLTTVTGLAGDAAAWVVAAGQPERAVELLEQGRQVLWSQALQTRSDLSELAAVAPVLADELDRTRRELDGAEAAQLVELPAHPGWELGRDLLTSALGGPHRAETEDAGHRRRLAERWEQLVAEARRRPGFAGFLRPPSFADLQPATAGGAAVLVNTSRWRSDAIIVTADGVRAVPLPWLSHDTAQQRAVAFLKAQRAVEEGGGPAERVALRQTLVTLQRWLWDTVGEPVCAALDDVLGSAPDRRHRVWWCPTGPLTMLPLHAAGRFGASAPLAAKRRISVAARCVSSYTPSLTALLRARAASASPGPPRAFAVGLGVLPGQAPLPAVSDELRAVSSHVPGLRVLTGRNATVEGVLTALGQHGWAHFACHGDQDFERPSAAALRLVDGRLSVLDLAGRLAARSRSAGGADLAYLSACRTAAGGRDLPDEAIHLTAALQMAGFRHVIGSQWAVSDRVAAQVADDVYAGLRAGERLDADTAAVALDRAVDRVRRAHPDRPELWAALIHTGP